MRATQILRHRSMCRKGKWSVPSHSMSRSSAPVRRGEVAADAEPLVGAGEAHGVERGLAVGPDRGALQRAVHVLGVGIAPLGSIDAQVQRAPVDVCDDVRAPEIGDAACDRRVGHGRR